MTLLIKTILKSKSQRDRILPINDIKAIAIDGLIYFFGGTIENNISKSVFHYDLTTKEIIKYTDIPTEKEIVVILKKDNLIAINNIGEVFIQTGGVWSLQDSIEISPSSCGIITSTKQYIISDNVLYEFDNSNIIKVVESNTISADNYIPSTDKDIVYFKESKVNLNTKEIDFDTNEGDYIIYGYSYKSSEDNIIIDKINKYLVTYTSPMKTIGYKTVSSKNWYKDDINDNIRQFNPLSNIVSNGNKIFFSEKNSTEHNAYSLNINDMSIVLEDTIQRKNYSYSKNIIYNHSSPYIITYNNSTAFMGNGGYYTDNSIYDNSIYRNNNVIAKLSLNLHSPIYKSTNNTILIYDDRTSIDEYTLSGEYLNSIEIPAIEDIKDFDIYNNRVNINSSGLSCVYDIKNKKIISKILHINSIASTMSKNFLFKITRNDSLKISKVSLYSGYAVEAELESIDEYKDIKLYSNGDNQLIMYVEKENYEWTIYRIVFDE